MAAKAVKTRREHCCSNCGFTSVQYFGSCPNCSEFGTCGLSSKMSLVMVEQMFDAIAPASLRS
jgi:predicted ATP-dependent serine protease